MQAAKNATPFALLLNPDDAALVAPDDMVDEIRAYASRTGQAVPSDDGVLYRAALEGLALRYRVCLGMLESLVEHRIDTIHIVGGGSLNEFLCQMTADACDRTVVAGPVEATATGNLLMQMIGTGQLKNVEEARALVRASFDTTRYEPQNPQAWAEPAERLRKAVGRTGPSELRQRQRRISTATKLAWPAPAACLFSKLHSRPATPVSSISLRCDAV